jgi:hypothetical protein
MAADELQEMNPYAAPASQVDLLEDTPAGKSKGIDLAVENPWLTIWTRPRATIRGIVETKPGYGVLRIALLYSLFTAFSQLQSYTMAPREFRPGMLGLFCLVGLLVWAPLIFLMGWLYAGVGRWLGGQATAREMRAAISWPLVPMLTTVPLWLVVYVVFAKTIFGSEPFFLPSNSSLFLASLVVMMVQVVLSIWGFVLMLKTIGEVHRFSAWKALGTILLAGLVAGVVLLGIVLVFMGIATLLMPSSS